MARKNLSVQGGRNVEFASDEPKPKRSTRAKVATQVCRVCAIEKPLTDFRRKASKPLGVDNICALDARAWLANRNAKRASEATATTTKRASSKPSAKRSTTTTTTKPAAKRATKRSTNDDARAAADAKRVASVAKRVASNRAPVAAK